MADGYLGDGLNGPWREITNPPQAFYNYRADLLQVAARVGQGQENRLGRGAGATRTNEENGGGALPPGQMKKLDRGGSLPPGQMKKMQ